MTKAIRQYSLALVLIFAAGFAAQAKADLLLEPYLGYYTGTEKQTGSKDYTVSGVGYGARVGFQRLGFMIGGDLMSGSQSINTTPSATVTPSRLGVFAGYNFPVLLRAYAAYDLMDDRKVAYSGSTSNDKGSGIKLGVGFTGLPFISINLEYISSTYTKNQNGNFTNDATLNQYGLSVSLPFTL